MPDKLKPFLFRFLSFLFFCLAIFSSHGSVLLAQENHLKKDSLVPAPGLEGEKVDSLTRDPKKAAMYSAMFPGMGQFYNKKYWKMPIVYAGFGTFVYFINRNTRYYKDIKNKLLDPDYEMKYFEGDFTEDQLTRGKDMYKRWRDLSIIGTAGFYVLQIIDATVDAYLFDWNVGENISMRVEPSFTPVLNPLLPLNSFGLSACISF